MNQIFVQRWVLVPLVSAGLCCPAVGMGFTEIVAFGDSLSDGGNRAVATNANSTKYPRQVWVSQLAGPDFLNISDFRPAGKAAFTGGSNYAFGGATTEYVAKLKVGDATGYNLTKQISGQYLNPAFNTLGARPDALHVLRIGGNDIMFAATLPDQAAAGWSGLPGIAVAAAKDTEAQIESLGRAGVKVLLWLNLSDPSKMPAVRKTARMAGPMAPVLLDALTRAAKAFNAEMDSAIGRLKTVCPSLRIVKLDVDDFFEKLAADPGKYGFTTLASGANDDGHFFSVDQLHPTSHGHRVLAEFAFRELLKSQTASARAAPATAP